MELKVRKKVVKDNLEKIKDLSSIWNFKIQSCINRQNGDKNMDMHLLELQCMQSDFFKANLIAANSANPRYAEDLSRILNLIQMKPYLSKKFLKEYKNTVEYNVMQKKQFLKHSSRLN